MKEHQISQRTFVLFMVAAVSGLYILAGIAINPFILWVSLPFYIGYFIIITGHKKSSLKLQYRGMGYLAFSLILTYLYHLAWYFNWDGTKTSSSTSAIIFFILPLYVAVTALAGYFIGPWLAKISISDCS